MALGALGSGTVNAETPRSTSDGYSLVALVDDDGAAIDDFEAGDVEPVAQVCETNGTTTTCLGKGWLAGKVCGWLGGEIVAGDPDEGVFLCEGPTPR